MSANQFDRGLRAEYDPYLFDVVERRKKAQQLQAALKAAQRWQPPQSILDVGCGTGLIPANLDAPNALKVGCDIRSELYLKNDTDRAIAFAQANCARLPFVGKRFELVTCLAVIGEFPDWRAAVTEMARCVAPGGCLYITVANSPALLKKYALEEKLGRAVRLSSKSYANACLPMFEQDPARGWELPALAGWDYIDVTPYLARAAAPALAVVPIGITSRLMHYAAPSLGHLWKRPA
jgi:ubiquinone/menaquinone biosynthesis C-methylase UbiE